MIKSPCRNCGKYKKESPRCSQECEILRKCQNEILNNNDFVNYDYCDLESLSILLGE